MEMRNMVTYQKEHSNQKKSRELLDTYTQVFYMWLLTQCSLPLFPSLLSLLVSHFFCIFILFLFYCR